MYGHQFRQGPPTPPPPFPSPQPGPLLPYQQVLPGPPPPPVYQHGPPPPAAPPMQMNMAQPYIHPPPPVYSQPGPPYLFTHQAPQPMPPRMLPPPQHLQGQVLYPTPPLPSPGIHHVPAPPPPPPPSFVSITPAPFASFMHPLVGNVHPPPCLPPSPPPLPPSPPPPQPSSPPPPPPMEELTPTVPDELSTEPMDCVDIQISSANATSTRPMHDSVPHVEGEILLVQGEESRDSSLSPPKPAEEAVRTIEKLCRFIADVGPDFENLARMKEAGNPQFSFLFGGEPGSADAIAHEYFRWMKRKYQFQTNSCEVLEQATSSLRIEGPSSTGNMEDRSSEASPAISDMDMEDDVVPEGDVGYNNKGSTGDQEFASSEVNSVNRPLQLNQTTTKQLGPVVQVSHTASSSDSLQPLQNRKDDNDSPFMEDVSPVRASADSAKCILQGVSRSVRTSTGDLNLVKVQPDFASGKTMEIPRVFVKDRSPFQLIQSYASDDSEEDDKQDCANDTIAISASPIAASDIRPENASIVEVGPEHTADSSHLITSKEPKEFESVSDFSAQKATSQNINSARAVLLDGKIADDKASAKLPQDIDTVEGGSNSFDNHSGNFIPEVDVRQDLGVLDVDEFGRLVREGASDSDSDGMHYNERRSKRGRSRSRSPSPQESRWRRRSRTPRRRHKQSHSPSWSPRSRSNSPPDFRQTNVFSRRERDQPPECFNFIRGRCFRGASCRFIHRGFGQHRSRQQEYQEHPLSGNYGMHDDVPASENSYVDKTVVTEMGAQDCNNIPLEEKHPEMEEGKELAETSIKMIEGEPLDKKIESGTVPEGAQPSVSKFNELQVTDQVFQEESFQVQEPQQVEELIEASIADQVEGKNLNLIESSQPLQADCSQSYHLAAARSQSLSNDTLSGHPNSGEGTSCQPFQPGSSTTISGQPQYPTQYAHAFGHMVHHLPAEEFQSSNLQPHTIEAPTQVVRVPVSHPYPSHGPSNQPHTNYIPVNLPPEQTLLSKEFQPPSFPAPLVNFQSTQLLPPPPQGHPPPIFPSENTIAPFTLQNPKDNHQSTAASHHSLFSPSNKFSSHLAHITSDYNSQSFPAPNPCWPSLPPPPPLNVTTLPSRPTFPPVEHFLQFSHNTLPPRSDFNPQLGMRFVSHGEHIRPQAVDLRVPFHPVQPSYQPPLHIDDSRQMPLHMGNQQDQQFARDQFPCSQIIADSQRDSHLHHRSFLHEQVQPSYPGQGFTSGPFDQGGRMHPQSLPFPKEPFSGKPHLYTEDYLPPRVTSKEQFLPACDLPKRSPHGPPDSNKFLSTLSSLGVDEKMTRYPPTFGETIFPPPRLSEIEIPKMPISVHHNPYASTFEQIPSSLKFASNVFVRENDTNHTACYESSFNPGNVPVNGSGPRITASPSISRRPGEQLMMARPGLYSLEAPTETLPPNEQKQSVRKSAEAYDPLFDSIEPPSNVFKKLDNVKEDPAVDDFECKQKGSIAAEPKLEADEFGDVATDAEVGAVENGSPLAEDVKDLSPDVPIDAADTNAGEIEIDQVRSPGKSKKSKDSRSMRLFKIALADFVKEVLKPSWRQGNMSKEAFKTIVKKTVDKVSGAMPSRQVPKTQVKISQYVESSQKKLTKLVMGYVDKYVKV